MKLLNKKVILALISGLLMVGSGEVLGQYTSDLGRFEVDEIRGCAPFTVNFTILEPACPCDAVCPCDMNFEGIDPPPDNMPQNQFFYTFDEPGTYNLQVIFQGLTPRIDFIVIEVIPNEIPEFEIFNCSNESVQVLIDDSQYDEYAIDYFSNGTDDAIVPQGTQPPPFSFGAPGVFPVQVRGRNIGFADNCNSNEQQVMVVETLPVSFIELLTLHSEDSATLRYTPQPNTFLRLEVALNNNPVFQNFAQIDQDNNTIALTGFSFQNNFYRFRIATWDPCNDVFTYSNEVSSLNFSLEIQDNLNRLDWNTSGAGVDNYRIARNENQNFISVTNMFFNDIDVVCNQDYCYTVTTRYANGARSISLMHCGTATSSIIPPPISNLSLNVSENELAMTWPTPEGFTQLEARVLRQEGTGFSQVRFVTENNFTYNDTPPQPDLCFRVDYTDECGNDADPGIVACILWLEVDEAGPFAHELEWNEYTGFGAGVSEYRVQRFDEDGLLTGEFSAGNETRFTDTNITDEQQIYSYRVLATSGLSGIDVALSNKVSIIKNPNLNFPNAFTPGNDGLNDEFRIFGRFIKEYELTVFNRWGELVFQADTPEKTWNGIYRGALLPQGTYAYRAMVVDQAGRKHSLDGTVLLIIRP